MFIEYYFHRCDESALKENPLASTAELLDTLEPKIEKGRARELREEVFAIFLRTGWSSRIRLNTHSQITITAVHSNVGLCLQTGNISRIYADLLKLEYLYRKDSIQRAGYIVPTRTVSRSLGSNLAYFERLVDELAMFDEIVTVPMIVVGLG